MKNNNSLNILLHPLFLLSLLVFLFNDHYLKNNFPSFLIGKISDFAGLFVFTIFLSALADKFASKFNLTLVIYLFTFLLFSFVKLVPINTWLPDNSLPIFPFIYPDTSDLIAVIILPISYFFYRKKSYNYLPKINYGLIKIIIPLTCFGIIATSQASYNFTLNFPSPSFQKLKPNMDYSDFEKILNEKNYTVFKKELEGSNINYKFSTQKPITIDSLAFTNDHKGFILYSVYDLTLNKRGYFLINQIKVSSFDDSINYEKTKLIVINDFLKSIEDFIQY